MNDGEIRKALHHVRRRALFVNGAGRVLPVNVARPARVFPIKKRIQPFVSITTRISLFGTVPTVPLLANRLHFGGDLLRAYIRLSDVIHKSMKTKRESIFFQHTDNRELGLIC
jgi:hypothetical protein